MLNGGSDGLAVVKHRAGRGSLGASEQPVGGHVGTVGSAGLLICTSLVTSGSLAILLERQLIIRVMFYIVKIRWKLENGSLKSVGK